MNDPLTLINTRVTPQTEKADPADPSSIDLCGLDSAVPNLIADFSAGRV